MTATTEGAHGTTASYVQSSTWATLILLFFMGWQFWHQGSGSPNEVRGFPNVCDVDVYSEVGGAGRRRRNLRTPSELGILLC